ncbi:MAG: glutamate 5-kinase [Nanoarchaeota archaeon]
MARDLKAHRLVLKIGTSTLTRNGKPDIAYIQCLADTLSRLKKEGKQFVIVTSGAIGAGCAELGLATRVRDIHMRQATAAIGQGIIMKRYYDAFAKHGVKVAQILLTYDDFSQRKRYVHLKSSLSTLLKLGVVPIINENDPVSIDEIGPSFGDNDRLSALVAAKCDADLLVIMSDIDGLFTNDPKQHKDAKLLPEVRELTKDIEASAGAASSSFGLGGMQSKIKAVKLCMSSGVPVIICNGRDPAIVEKICAGAEVGTLFLPKGSLDEKKRWILAAKPKGSVIIDQGAKKALLSGKNLLPAGIVEVRQHFEKGDVVSLSCGEAFAKAIVDFSSEQLQHIKGKHSAEIEKALGKQRYENVVRRENLVFL